MLALAALTDRHWKCKFYPEKVFAWARLTALLPKLFACCPHGHIARLRAHGLELTPRTCLHYLLAVIIAMLLIYGAVVAIIVTAMMNEGRVHSWFYGYVSLGRLAGAGYAPVCLVPFKNPMAWKLLRSLSLDVHIRLYRRERAIGP